MFNDFVDVHAPMLSMLNVPRQACSTRFERDLGMAKLRKLPSASDAVEAQLLIDMGQRIRALRESAGMTQEDLAKKIAAASGDDVVSKGAVSYWENGTTKNVKLRSFLGLCDALNARPRYLVFNERPVSPTPAEKIAQLTPEAVEMAVRIANMPSPQRENVVDMFFALSRTKAPTGAQEESGDETYQSSLPSGRAASKGGKRGRAS